MSTGGVISTPQLGRLDQLRLPLRQRREPNRSSVSTSDGFSAMSNENERDGVAFGDRDWSLPFGNQQTFRETDLESEHGSPRRFPIYKAFDIHDIDEVANQDFQDLDSSYFENDGESESPLDKYDVEPCEDRAIVPRNLVLSPMTKVAGMRGHIFIKNKSKLNLTFFVSTSSRLLHVKTPVGWLPPNDTYKIHVKTHVPYPKIKDEIIKIYAAPLHFLYQINEVKLEEFWKGLGSRFNPIDLVDVYNVNIILCRELEEKMSILDHVTLTPLGWKHKNTQVEIQNVIEPVNTDKTYAEFWGIREEDYKLAMIIEKRELERATRRSFEFKPSSGMKWRSLICTGIAVTLGTVFVYMAANDPKITNEILNQLPEMWFMKNEEAVQELVSILPQSPPAPLVPELSIEPTGTWSSCFELPSMDQVPGMALKVSKCLITRLVESFY